METKYEVRYMLDDKISALFCICISKEEAVQICKTWSDNNNTGTRFVVEVYRSIVFTIKGDG